MEKLIIELDKIDEKPLGEALDLDLISVLAEAFKEDALTKAHPF